MPKLFVSYPRENKREVDELVGHLQRLNYEVWADSFLRGGQAWWEEIIRRIAECDGFIAIVSHGMLNSVACRREREWALKLRKPVVPVAVERISEILPGDLSPLQIVDYSTPEAAPAFDVAAALAKLGPAPPPPEPLPDPPPAPLSYLPELVDHVLQDEPLTQEQQRRIVDHLETALGSTDPEEQEDGHEILDFFIKREDLFHDIQRRVARLRAKSNKPLAPRSRSHPSTSEAGLGGPGESSKTAGTGSPARRDQAPPPQGPSSARSPEQPGPPRKRTKIITMVGVIAVSCVAVTVLVIAGAMWLKRPQPVDPQTTLLNLLPAAYRHQDICTPGPPPPGSSLAGALAFVKCHQDSDPSVPPNAAFGLFGNSAELDHAWHKAVSNDPLEPCPVQIATQGGDKFGCAHYRNYPQQPPELMWTNESKLLFGAIFGEGQPPRFTLEQLCTWWTSRY